MPRSCCCDFPRSHRGWDDQRNVLGGGDVLFDVFDDGGVDGSKEQGFINIIDILSVGIVSSPCVMGSFHLGLKEIANEVWLGAHTWFCRS